MIIDSKISLVPELVTKAFFINSTKPSMPVYFLVTNHNGTSMKIQTLCLGPIGDFCIGDGEMYSYTRDASRCLAILSINTSRLFTQGRNAADDTRSISQLLRPL